MFCPKCGEKMTSYLPESGYANAFKCLSCGNIVESSFSNDRDKFITLLESLNVTYVTGETKHEFYDKNGFLQLTVEFNKSDICICDHYFDFADDEYVPLNTIYNLIIKFDEAGTFLGFEPYCAE